MGETEFGADKQESPKNPEPGANRPDFRVVQTDRDQSGNIIYKSVGGMWKGISKNGNEFYTLKKASSGCLSFRMTESKWKLGPVKE